MCQLQVFLPRRSLVTVFKAFIRPHLDYGDIIYDQTYNESFHQKMESIQYSAALAITGAIRGTSREKPYQDLGLKVNLRSISSKYFLALAKHIIQELTIRFPSSVVNINFFINSFFPSTAIKWNNLDLKIRNKTFPAFKKIILKFLRPSSNSIFNCDSPKGIKLITRLRLGLSHLCEHKFRDNFRILLIQFTVMGMTSRLQFITYFIVQII